MPYKPSESDSSRKFRCPIICSKKVLAAAAAAATNAKE